MKYRIEKIIKILALFSLAGAYTYGYLVRETESYNAIKNYFPGKEITEVGDNPTLYEIKNSKSYGNDGLLVIGTAQGWGGPLKTGTFIDTSGTVSKVIVLNHKETPSFFQSLFNQGFFERFIEKDVSSPFQTGEDIDAVSGATISSKGFSKAVRDGSHWVGRNRFDMDIDETPVTWKVGSNEFILIVLYAVVIVSSLKQYRKVRKVVLAFSVGFIGFYMSSPISVSNFSSLLLGYFPSVHQYAFLWLIVIGTLLLTVIYGRNLYCGWMCPFGGMQEFISIIGGVRLRLNKATVEIAQYFVYVLFWVSFMITFITSNPGLGSFEPFGTLFSFKGVGIQWYLVSAALLGSFLIPRFWCRFFCPAGLVLRWISNARKKILDGARIWRTEKSC